MSMNISFLVRGIRHFFFSKSDTILGLLFCLLLNVSVWQGASAQFRISELALESLPLESGSAIQFGPDGRLYVGEFSGKIKAYTVVRQGIKSYTVENAEEITFINQIINHDDDGTTNASVNTRRLTGIYVAGTAERPVIYVSSSDSREGGPSGDKNLDTNSGIITRLSWKPNTPPSQTNIAALDEDQRWEKVDLIRGLPRSEELHAVNSLVLSSINGTKKLLVCVGGNTNAGSPSRNFAYLSEYALSAAVLAFDLGEIEAMPIKGSGDTQYIYDLPTLDDPTRANVNGITNPSMAGYDGIDVGDPFGGNDGLNQAKLIADAPFEVFAPGFRNPVDLVITEARRLYVSDKGAIQTWGGLPENEGPADNGGGSTVTNRYHVDGAGNELGSTDAFPFEGQVVVNRDHLNLITGLGAGTLDAYMPGTYYGGHPVPVRANPDNAGLWTQSGSEGLLRTNKFNPAGGVNASNPNTALPADWPPVLEANSVEGDFRNPGDDGSLTTWQNNTYGLAEYSASNLGGLFQGNLFAVNSTGFVMRAVMNADGSLSSLNQKFSPKLENLQDLACLSDNSTFPGTIWLLSQDGHVYVMEPEDYDASNTGICIQPGEVGYNGSVDYDGDGYSNDDENTAGTNLCDGTDFPTDFDEDLVSDVNDPDDDNDNVLDTDDVFQMGMSVNLPVIYELFPNSAPGFKGLGFTGVMANDDDYLNAFDPSDLEGNNGRVALFMTDGDAEGVSNDQEKAFQFGVNVSMFTGVFTVEARMRGAFHDHKAGEHQGIYIGTGDQDNYIRLSLQELGLELYAENAGVAQVIDGFTVDARPIPGNSGVLDLFLTIDPLAGTVQPRYSLDGGAINTLGTNPLPILAGDLLTAIRAQDQPMAVGVIGTAISDSSFATQWDFIKVRKGRPFQNELAEVRFRVNAGGPFIAAIDGALDWTADENSSSIYRNSGSGTGATTAETFDASIPLTTPRDIFQTERFDPSGGTNLVWSFPVEVDSTYLVRLYLVNGWSGAREPGKRVFDILLEGETVVDNLDLSGDHGHRTAIMYELPITAGDEELNIEFISEIQNPIINGIEILQFMPGITPEKSLVLNPAEVDFEQQVLGIQSVNKGFLVENNGNTQLMIDNISITGTDAGLFGTIDTFKVLVNAGSSTMLDFFFTPESEGARSAIAELTHNADTMVNPLEVELRGEGVTSTLLYRINAGGPTVAPTDGDIEWQKDESVFSDFHNGSSKSSTNFNAITTLDGSVPKGTPLQIFFSERFDPEGGEEMIWKFPVSAGKRHTVRLYMTDGFSGTAQPGARVFDIKLEDNLKLEGLDLSKDFGSRTGAMIELQVDVLDDTLSVEFVRQVQNPLVNGVEVLEGFLVKNSPTLSPDFRFAVYPNPASDQVIVDIKGDFEGGLGISLLDISGRTVLQQQLNKQGSTYQTSLELEDLAQGVYILQLNHESFRLTKKIVKLGN